MPQFAWNLETEPTLIKNFIAKLKRHPKRIVFSEGEDSRVILVASKLTELEVIAPILLGNRDRITALANELGVDLTLIGILDPQTADETELFCEYYTKSERFRGIKVANPRETVQKPQNFAALMTQYGFADAMLSGNQVEPITVYRSAVNMIKPVNENLSPFGVTMIHQASESDGRTSFLSDTSIIPDPDVQQLAFMAEETASFARHIIGHSPRVAMLSHSTRGSNANESSKKVQAATQLAQSYIESKNLNFSIIGEVQSDVALDASSHECKLGTSIPFQEADVLIFPNLDSANISYHLLEIFADIKSYGHFVKGFTKPIAQVSRSADVESMLGTSIILGAEAIKYRLLYDR